MKKLLALLFVFAICGSIAFAGFGNGGQGIAEESSEAAPADTAGAGTAIEETLIGSWMMADRNGQPAFTNEKAVFTFVSPTKAYISAAYNSHAELGTAWIHQLEADVSIDGSKVTLTWPASENRVMVDEFSISVISDTEQQGNLIVKSIEDGKETIVTEEPIRLVKVSKDYSRDILGTWEGRSVSEDSPFDDGRDHRWEYKEDGTYVYYVKDGDNWVPGGDTLNEYFVAGNLLCTRWMEDNAESREWWEISIDGDKMSWTALRQGDDGKAFTAEFEMTKVSE